MTPAARVSSGLRCAARNLSTRLAEAPPRHVRHYGFGNLTNRTLGRHDASEEFGVVPEAPYMASA